MKIPDLTEIESAMRVVRTVMPPTPQYSWPLLNTRVGADLWVKHENHSPVGAFKLRGAAVYMDWLKHTQPEVKGVIAATRGNHGQGVALAASLLGLTAVVVVPHRNSREKNSAMKSQGAELIEHGEDFQAALEYPENLGVGQPYREGRLPEVDCWMGVAYDKLGNSAKSKEMFQQAVAALEPERRREQPEMQYYAGLAAQKLGRSAEAARFFRELIEKGDTELAEPSNLDYFAKFGQRRSRSQRLAEAHYLIGLGNLGNGQAAKARDEFQAALKLNVNHLGARIQLMASSTPALAAR